MQEDIDSLALNVRRTVEKTSDISSPVAFSADILTSVSHPALIA